MATKDWKKVKNGVVDYLWEKNTSSSYFGNMEVWVYKTRDKNEKVKWAVTIRDVGMGSNNKLFKTKTKALAYAKSYMRRN